MKLIVAYKKGDHAMGTGDVWLGLDTAREIAGASQAELFVFDTPEQLKEKLQNDKDLRAIVVSNHYRSGEILLDTLRDHYPYANDLTSHVYMVRVYNDEGPYDWTEGRVFHSFIGPLLLREDFLRHGWGVKQLEIEAPYLPTRINPNSIRQAAEAWRAARDEVTPRPVVTLLIGSSSDISEDLTQIRKVYGPTHNFCYSTGMRTDDAITAHMEKEFLDALEGYVFRKDQGSTPNPYEAIIGLADIVIAATDSLSMMTDAVNSGKRVFLIGGDMKRLYRDLLKGGNLAPAPEYGLREKDFSMVCKLFRYGLAQPFDPDSQKSRQRPVAPRVWSIISKLIHEAAVAHFNGNGLTEHSFVSADRIMQLSRAGKTIGILEALRPHLPGETARRVKTALVKA